MNNQQRPRYLNLLKIHLPLTGIVSILHRVSGVILIASLPFALCWLDLSTSSSRGYEQVMQWSALPLIRLMIWLAIWALLHHVCAGIRFLFLDLHIGVSLFWARQSAWIAFLVSIFLTLIVGIFLWR